MGEDEKVRQLKIRLFLIMTSFCSILALLTILLSFFSSYWLLTAETWKGPSERNESTVKKDVHSGLWEFCYYDKKDLMNNEWKDTMNSDGCVPISDSKSESDDERPTSTRGALKKITHYSGILMRICLAVLSTAFIINVAGHVLKTKIHICFFVSGVLFVFSGLLLILTLVIYASKTNEIAESWPTVVESEDKTPGKMKYRYGWSFFCCGLCLIASEWAGVFAMYFVLARANDIFISQLNKDSKEEKNNDGLLYNCDYSFSDAFSRQMITNMRSMTNGNNARLNASSQMTTL